MLKHYVGADKSNGGRTVWLWGYQIWAVNYKCISILGVEENLCCLYADISMNVCVCGIQTYLKYKFIPKLYNSIKTQVILQNGSDPNNGNIIISSLLTSSLFLVFSWFIFKVIGAKITKTKMNGKTIMGHKITTGNTKNLE